MNLSDSKRDYTLCLTPHVVTVREIRARLKADDEPAKDYIINFIDHRIRGRYLNPLNQIPREHKSGFLMMATGCLLIETLQSFQLGLNDTKRESKLIFHGFFTKEESRFPGFTKFDFFRHIRCAILHQTETTGGYRILRKGPLFDTDLKAINADSFMRKIEQCLDAYIAELKASNNTAIVWTNAKKKIGHICDNCTPCA